MNIAVLGCGWLGLPLAEHLIDQRHTIKGSTTTKSKIRQLNDRSIEPYLLTLDPELSEVNTAERFWDVDVLILNIPPGRGKENVIAYHSRQIQSVVDSVTGSAIKFVLFISSTSVYPKHPGTVTEDDAVPGKAGRDSGNALLQAEKLLFDCSDFETTVLRFGGLYGGERHPAKYMAGRTGLGKASAPVNLIHREDCIAIITQIVEGQITGKVFNAVSDGHPTRKEYYTKAARALELKPPAFKPDEKSKSYKVVSNARLKKALSYSFIYPEPLIPSPG